mgnify:CR=1 FL=1
MKKLFTLIGALLLWQSVAVAQNYLHIWTGDTTKIVPMAQLDSVTVRDAEFYELGLSNVDGLRFGGSVVDYFDREFTFDVTLAQGEGTTVYIRNLDPNFAGYGYVAEIGYNILAGELAVAADKKSATITCQMNQAIGYEDCIFTNPFGGSTIEFTLTEETFTCETGYGVCTASGSWYTVFNPFTLNVVAACADAPVRKANVVEPAQLKAVKQLSPMTTPQETAIKKEGAKALQLMTVPADQTIK